MLDPSFDGAPFNNNIFYVRCDSNYDINHLNIENELIYSLSQVAGDNRLS